LTSWTIVLVFSFTNACTNSDANHSLHNTTSLEGSSWTVRMHRSMLKAPTTNNGKYTLAPPKIARLYAVFHFSYSSWLKPAPFWASLTCSTVKRSWSKSPRFAVEPRRQRVVPLFRNFAHRDIR